jgi:hypothetical protein
MAMVSAVALTASVLVVSTATTTGAADGNTVVALFYDDDYVDVCDDPDCEATNVRNLLEEEGAQVNLIEGIDELDFSAALEGADLLVVPELEEEVAADPDAANEATTATYDLGPDLSPEARQVIADFVAATGRAMFFGGSDPSETINTIFGFAVSQPEVDVCTIHGPDDEGCVANESAVGTEFEGLGPLAWQDATTGLDGGTLPAGSIVPFDDVDIPGLYPVAVMPFGDGSVVYNGYDWFLGGAELQLDPDANGGWAGVFSQATTPYLVEIEPAVSGTGETLDCLIDVGPGSQGVLVEWESVFDDGSTFSDSLVLFPGEEAGALQAFTNSPLATTATATITTPYFGQTGNNTCVFTFERPAPPAAPAVIAPVAATEPAFTG